MLGRILKNWKITGGFNLAMAAGGVILPQFAPIWFSLLGAGVLCMAYGLIEEAHPPLARRIRSVWDKSSREPPRLEGALMIHCESRSSPVDYPKSRRIYEMEFPRKQSGYPIMIEHQTEPFNPGPDLKPRMVCVFKITNHTATPLQNVMLTFEAQKHAWNVNGSTAGSGALLDKEQIDIWIGLINPGVDNFEVVCAYNLGPEFFAIVPPQSASARPLGKSETATIAVEHHFPSVGTLHPFESA
jgi:hypothetical protein